MRKIYGKKISNDFLDQIEDRIIVFVEDGADLRDLKIGVSEGHEVYQSFFKNNLKDAPTERVIHWKNYPK
jgi:hypothetical protein